MGVPPRRALVGVATVGGAFLLWWLATSGLRLLNPLRLPSPAEVWAAFLQINAGGGYVSAQAGMNFAVTNTGIGKNHRDHNDHRTMITPASVQAVVGLSGDPSRTAYAIADLLHSRGKTVVPIHPDAPTVFGRQGYTSLAEVPFEIDVVDVFRRSEAAGAFVQAAVCPQAHRVEAPSSQRSGV